MGVKFLKPCQQGTLYNKGEIAGFDRETEARLIKQGYAEAHKAPAETPEPAPKPERAPKPEPAK